MPFALVGIGKGFSAFVRSSKIVLFAGSTAMGVEGEVFASDIGEGGASTITLGTAGSVSATGIGS